MSKASADAVGAFMQEAGSRMLPLSKWTDGAMTRHVLIWTGLTGVVVHAATRNFALLHFLGNAPDLFSTNAVQRRMLLRRSATPACMPLTPTAVRLPDQSGDRSCSRFSPNIGSLARKSIAGRWNAYATAREVMNAECWRVYKRAARNEPNADRLRFSVRIRRHRLTVSGHGVFDAAVDAAAIN
ncbi:hypothetical protein PSPO01_00053 [Paraphaeosphaeria sporulosa]